MLRWWLSGEIGLDDEAGGFEAAGLDFELDEKSLHDGAVVIFNGRLRLGPKSVAAAVVYPPSYIEGAHPRVYARHLDLGRHSEPSTGLLCLDHLDPGDLRPMSGAEAVMRAQELWRLTVEDPERLRDLEVDAPFPAALRYQWEPFSAAFIVCPDVGEESGGWARLEGGPLVAVRDRWETAGQPIRGQVTGLGVGVAGPELPVRSAISALAGPQTMIGLWHRLAAAPPAETRASAMEWIEREHSNLLRHAVQVALTHRTLNKLSNWTFIAFVYPDESRAKNELHDTWLLAAIHLDNRTLALAPLTLMGPDDQYLRQRNMRGLGSTHVVIVGAGALGSQVADSLARAGVNEIDIVDPERFDPGNVVRHQLTLRESGLDKAEALHAYLQSVNPFMEGRVLPFRLGGFDLPPEHAAFARAAHEDCMNMLAGADLIVNTTAAQVPSRWLATFADSLRINVLHSSVSAGAWSARIYLQRAGSGCPECVGLHQADGSDIVPAWSEDPDGFGVVGAGCSQPTFSAPNFELAHAAAVTSRMAVQALLTDHDYPALTYDMATLIFRDATTAEPSAHYTRLPRHPSCRTCAA